MNGYRKELVSPSGETYVSTSPRETNDLIYNSGYREADASASPQKAPTRPVSAEKGSGVSVSTPGGEVSP